MQIDPWIAAIATSVADPLGLIGYLAAGLLARSFGRSLLYGAGWAFAIFVVELALYQGGVPPLAGILIRMTGGALAALVTYLLARHFRRRSWRR